MLTDESEILVPSKDTIIIFRRDLDGKIYYKASDNSITQITEEDGIYKIQSVEGLLFFKNIILPVVACGNNIYYLFLLKILRKNLIF